MAFAPPIDATFVAISENIPKGAKLIIQPVSLRIDASSSEIYL